MGCDNEEEEQSMRVDKSVIVLFRQMNLFLNRELGQFTRNYTQTTKRGLLTTNKG